MNCKFCLTLLIALSSIGLPWRAAIAVSSPGEKPASSSLLSTLIPEAGPEPNLTGVDPIPSATKTVAKSPEASAVKTATVPVDVEAMSEPVLAGLPFTDIERRETTIHNTGGTVDPWLSPDAPLTEAEAEAEAESEEPDVEPPLEWRDPALRTQSPTVDGLSDVDPDDWAFEAVRSLAEEYACLDGFPDGTFRGDQTLTRFEFAAALNACLNQVVDIRSQDRDTVAGLRQRFLTEISTDVDSLEAAVEELRENQFSTTTRLFGQVIFGLQVRNENTADFFPVDGSPETDDPSGGDTTFFSNAQLSLLTRFSRRDLLLLGLQAGEGNSLFDANSSTALGLTNNIRLSYEADTDFDVVVSDLTYRRLVGDSVALIAGAAGINQVSVFRGPSEEEGAGSGPLSLFAQRNPILSIGNGSVGFGFDWQIADRVSFQGVYAVPEAADNSNEGLFGGDRTLGFQLTASPTDTLNLAFNYINDYSTTGNLGTGIGDSQLAAQDPTTGDFTELTTNALGTTLEWDITPRVTLGGWFGYTKSVPPGGDGAVETTNWMTYLNFPDLFGPGHLGGLYVGQPPRITRSDLSQGLNIPDLLAGNLGDPGDQPDSTLHIEAFYRYQMTDYLSLTPGFIVIVNPSNTSGSDTIAIGALRTTFRF